MTEDKVVFDLMVKLSLKRGLRDIGKKPGLTELKVDDQWTLKINPHKETIDGIEQGLVRAIFEGLPVGLFTLTAGSMIADGEDRLIEALEKALEADSVTEQKKVGMVDLYYCYDCEDVFEADDEYGEWGLCTKCKGDSVLSFTGYPKGHWEATP